MKKSFVCLLALGMLGGSVLPLAGCKNQEKPHASYEITAEYSPDNHTVAGTVKVEFENKTNEEISALKFNLYPNAYRKDALYRPVSKTFENESYYAGESYGEIVVSSVNGSKNFEVLGEDENILYAYLERSLFPGDSVVLDIGFVTRLAKVNHRTGVTENTVNLGNFYPSLCGFKEGGFCECVYYSDGDPFYSDCADYKMTLTLPKEYEVAATGTLVDERILESKKVLVMEAVSARDFALVLAEEYRSIAAQVGNTKLVYYYYGDENAKETLQTAEEAFRYFEKSFGDYPYPVYTIAETDFCFGGMEYPCLTMLSADLEGEERQRSIVHETAHQWWGIAVGSDQIENAWQDEGLAEYSAFLFFDEYEKYGFKREELVTEALKEYRSYYDVYGSVLGRADTRMTRHLKEYLSDYEYRCLSYDKAVVMFDTLRKSVGEEKFSSALRKYYGKNTYKMASVGTLVGSFEKTGLDVSGFFDSFLLGKGVL